MVEILQPSSTNLMSKYVAAVDLGATSGRICIGWIEKFLINHLEVKPRFPPVGLREGSYLSSMIVQDAIQRP